MFDELTRVDRVVCVTGDGVELSTVSRAKMVRRNRVAWRRHPFRFRATHRNSFFFSKKKKAKRNRRHFYWVSPYDTLMTSIGFLKYGLCYCGSRRCVIERKLATVSSPNPSTEHRSHWPSKRVFGCCCCCCFFVTAIGSDEQSKCAAGDNIE